MALADVVLQPHCVRYQLNYSGIMHLLPGAKAQELHRDGDLYPFRHPCPPMLMPTMWALTDFTADNGATSVVPGSHRWAEERDPTVDEVVAGGDAGRLVAGLPRRHDPRWGSQRVAVAHAHGPRLPVLARLAAPGGEPVPRPTRPRSRARTPSALQRLIGYDYGAPYLGFVDGDSPQRLLQEDARRTSEPHEPRRRRLGGAHEATPLGRSRAGAHAAAGDTDDFREPRPAHLSEMAVVSTSGIRQCRSDRHS